MLRVGLPHSLVTSVRSRLSRRGCYPSAPGSSGRMMLCGRRQTSCEARFVLLPRGKTIPMTPPPLGRLQRRWIQQMEAVSQCYRPKSRNRIRNFSILNRRF
eukprot:Rmarinus@m.12432